jgi:hypothetical protein
MTYVEDHDVSCVVDSHHGIYCAQEFAARWGAFVVTTLTHPDGQETDHRPSWLVNELDTLMDGPQDHEDYWAIWAGIIDDCVVVLDGKRYRIDHREDVWLVRDGVEWCEDCDWWKSTECNCPHADGLRRDIHDGKV